MPASQLRSRRPTRRGEAVSDNSALGILLGGLVHEGEALLNREGGDVITWSVRDEETGEYWLIGITRLKSESGLRLVKDNESA